MDAGEKRVLIVDDDDAIRTLLFTILRRRGLAVDTARDGTEALERLERCRYALMLLDLMMPRVSGWEVLDTLARRPSDRRPVIIVLTAGTEPRTYSAELVAGSIRKPFDVELLLDTVAATIAALSQEPQNRNCPQAESAADHAPKH